MMTGRSAWPVSKGPERNSLWPPNLPGWTQDLPSPPAVVALGEHPELRKSLLPPLIIHTAATPMSLPKSSSTGVGEALGPGSRRTSSSGSAEPGTAHHEMKSPVRDCMSVPHCGRETGQQDDGLDRATRVREEVFLPSAPVLFPCDPRQD